MFTTTHAHTHTIPTWLESHLYKQRLAMKGRPMVKLYYIFSFICIWSTGCVYARQIQMRHLHSQKNVLEKLPTFTYVLMYIHSRCLICWLFKSNPCWHLQSTYKTYTYLFYCLHKHKHVNSYEMFNVKPAIFIYLFLCHLGEVESSSGGDGQMCLKPVGHLHISDQNLN